MSLFVTIVICSLAQFCSITATITMLFCSRLYRRKAAGGSVAEGGSMDDMVYTPRVSFKESGEVKIDYDVSKSHRRRHHETSQERKQKSHGGGTEPEDESLKLKSKSSSRVPAARVERKESSSTTRVFKVDSNDSSHPTSTRQSKKRLKNDNSY